MRIIIANHNNLNSRKRKYCSMLISRDHYYNLNLKNNGDDPILLKVVMGGG